MDLLPIILSPTRELAAQLYDDACAYAVNTHVKVARSYGDMPMRTTMEKIELGCDILVVTAGRLRDHIQNQHIKLTNLRYFVLDEGDSLIKSQKFYDTINCVKEHEDAPPDLQMLLFSATWDEKVQIVAMSILCRDYKFVKVGEMNQPVSTITQHFIEVEKSQKTEKLLEILQEGAEERFLPSGKRRLEPKMKTIVFCQQTRESDRLGNFLNLEDIWAKSLNGDRSSPQRHKASEDFTRGIFDVLVATDVAARGLNFPKVEHVIICDLPEHEDDDDMYIHRVGRTGRAGNAGMATIFFDPTNEANVRKAGHYIELLESNYQDVPDFLRRIAAENLENERERFYAGDGRNRGQRENGWGWGPNVPQEHNQNRQHYQPYQQSNGNHHQDRQHYQQSQQQEEHGWGPTMPTSSKEYRGRQEMHSSSAASLHNGQSSNATSSNEPVGGQKEEYLHDTW